MNTAMRPPKSGIQCAGALRDAASRRAAATLHDSEAARRGCSVVSIFSDAANRFGRTRTRIGSGPSAVTLLLRIATTTEARVRMMSELRMSSAGTRTQTSNAVQYGR